MLPGHVQPGVSTLELSTLAEEFIASHDGATPAFMGYHGFPNGLCTSVNEQCVHAIPTTEPLKEGDIVSLDCGVKIDGLYTDACITVPVGNISSTNQHLLKVTKGALVTAIPLIKAGVPVGDLSAHIQHYVESRDCNVIPTLTGHGLGYDLHEDPTIPNFGTKGKGAKLVAGSVIAIEPIVCLGDPEIITSPDGWSLSMRDGKNSAHFEHTILVLEDGCEVLA